MWMVLAQHLSHYPRRLLMGLIIIDAEFGHAKEHASVHRLQTVAHIGQCTGDDDRH